MANHLKQIGLYGGAFDPVHYGHIHVAINMMEIHRLNEVWFCPTKNHPFKGAECIPSADRLAMLWLAIEGIPGFRVIDHELRRDAPSYTVDTLEALVAEYPAYTFALILGEDAAREFHRWHAPEKILSLARPLVAPRAHALPSFAGDGEVAAALRQGFTPMPLTEISSTEVRRRIAAGKYCGHLVPGKVLDYIAKHELHYA